MALTKDDRGYIKDSMEAAIKPVKESIVRLEDQFDKHDDETKEINDVQQRMLGAWNLCKYAIIPVAAVIIGAVIAWLLMK